MKTLMGLLGLALFILPVAFIYCLMAEQMARGLLDPKSKILKPRNQQRK